MSDLIRREDAIDALVNLTCHGVEEIRSLCEASVADSEGWLGGIRDAIDELQDITSAEPERKIILCSDCRWWDRLEDGHPCGYCRACRSLTHTERWDISVYRQTKFNFYCADAEPREENEDK